MRSPHIKPAIALSVTLLAACAAPQNANSAYTYADANATGASHGTPTPVAPPPPAATVVPGSPARVAGNPFVETTIYVNPDYTAATRASTIDANTEDAALIAKARILPTAVWMDSPNAIMGDPNAGRRSLAAHLQQALGEAVDSNAQIILPIVLFNLPNRGCPQVADAEALAHYVTDFIEPIYALLSQPTYANLRFALVVEPSAMPFVITDPNTPCPNMVTGAITYAMQKFNTLPNAYIYLDVGHAAWLGWPATMAQAVPAYTRLVKGATPDGNLGIIRGFTSNIGNYNPIQEPYISNSNKTLLDGPFYSDNPEFDELSYVRALDANFRAAGFTDLGFILDTSRTGWALINDGKPIDRRVIRGSWCNISGPGLGIRPQGAPTDWPGLDAYLYVNEPGRSDGPSTDPQCDPNNPNLNAMPNAPARGAWFDAAFLQLLHRALPPL